MTYTQQHTPPWKAFVGTPKKAEEWTREMDWTIAHATNEWDTETETGNDHLIWPSYSTDLEAVVRAAERWAQKSGRWISLSSYDTRIGKWTASLNPNEAFIDEDEHYAVAPTPALALAKALYAAIKAEGENRMVPSTNPVSWTLVGTWRRDEA